MGWLGGCGYLGESGYFLTSGECGFEWRECQARRGEDMMYRQRSIWGEGTWGDLEWTWVPAGTMAVFGEVRV